ncbi:unnamed protein product [Arctia plantaginis]|uniref:Carboxylesterase type B domain-containing protein n=1 Tax=Arctia plantaginis TaxID=874455 RepID=A0A8S1B878_ARCPL|nr:unnamed protein product [Arctia plantaginis]
MGLCSTKWLVLWSLWAARLLPQPTLVIQLSNGPVRGTISPDGSHTQYAGIPYATIRQRFQSPGPHPTWDNVFDAINEHKHCFQSIEDTVMTGTKQCLILNVYNPLNTTPDAKLPVMVYFHGGGFFKGSSASLLAKVMLFESQDPYDLYNYFMTKSDADLILTRVPRKEGNLIASEILYTPCAEKLIEGEEPFLTKSPLDILIKGDYNKVPVMIGGNNEEGLLLFAMDNATMTRRITFEKSVPKNLEFPSENVKMEVAQKLKRLYMEGDKMPMEGETLSQNASVRLSRLMGEVGINYPALEETELLLKTNNNPIYNYMFQYYGNRNIPMLLMSSKLRGVKGATHADDIFYIFSQTIIPTTIFENNMIESMTTMWTNFAKYGDPTPDFTNPPVKWHRTNSTTPTALVIDSEFSTAPLWYNDRVKYLRELYSKFRRKG